MDIIILAGGLGTRLKSVVNEVPKVMAPVEGKPFLEYTLEYLNKFDINNVILAVGYKYEMIQNYFKDKYKKLNIKYSIETEPLGTGGAIKKAMNYSNEEDIIVINGDIIIKINYNDFYLKHKNKKENNMNNMIAVKKMKDFSRYGIVELDENNYVSNFKEKQYTKEGYINVGAYILNIDSFKNIKENVFSIEKDYFEKIVDKNKILSYQYDDIFLDIGIPEDYNKAKDYLYKLEL